MKSSSWQAAAGGPAEPRRFGRRPIPLYFFRKQAISLTSTSSLRRSSRQGKRETVAPISFCRAPGSPRAR
jgi:hypothetical protein